MFRVKILTRLSIFIFGMSRVGHLVNDVCGRAKLLRNTVSTYLLDVSVVKIRQAI